MTRNTLWIMAFLGLISGMVTGCSTDVKRLDVDEVRDLSGQWNDIDSRQVSREMIDDLLKQRWLPGFVNRHQNAPVVIVGEIRNLSHEHINLKTFVSDMERELINSGKVEFVASSDERGEIRSERIDQDLNASDATRKPAGEEAGADFMLQGQINTIFDREGRTTIKYYQVDLTLISMRDNKKVWVGQKKIKKAVKKPALRF